MANSILKETKPNRVEKGMTRAKKPGKVKTGVHSCKREISRDDSPERERTDEEEVEKPQKKHKSRHHGRLDNNEIETSDEVLHELRAEFGDMFDPCPFVGKGLRPEFDGRKIPWKEMNFINPPYDDISPWMERANREMRKRNHTSLIFVPVRTGTRYWEKLVYPHASEIRYLTGRIVFKGYKTPPPHHLCFIIYKSENEKKAERTNHNWNLDEIMEMYPAGKTLYPLLFKVMKEAQPVSKKYVDSEWITDLWSLSSLMEAFDQDTLSPFIKTKVLPLFLDMIDVFGYEHTIDEFDITESSQHILPELLRRSTYQFSQSQVLRDRIQNVVKSPTAKEFDLLVSFYEAFSTNAYIRKLNARKEFHMKKSYDGRFVQVVTFLH
jgi:hypothetical protein